MHEAIARALAPFATEVEVSARLRGPTTIDDGQYVLHMRGAEPAREVGLVLYRQSIPVAERPAFWINLIGGDQAIVAANESGLLREDLPPDWIASDYLEHRDGDCSIRFLALNPRRTLRSRKRGDGRQFVADSTFLPDHPVTRNLQARALFTFAPATRTVEALALMVHRASGAAEAEALLLALEPLLDEPAPDPQP